MRKKLWVLLYCGLLIGSIFSLKITTVTCSITTGQPCSNALKSHISSQLLGERLLFATHHQNISSDVTQYSVAVTSVQKKLPGTIMVSLEQLPTLYTFEHAENRYGVNSYGFLTAEPEQHRAVIVDELSAYLEPETAHKIQAQLHDDLRYFFAHADDSTITSINLTDGRDVRITTPTREYIATRDTLREAGAKIKYLEQQAVPNTNTIDLRFDLPVLQAK